MNSTDIPKAYAHGLQLQNAGQLEAALQIYSKILALRPNLAEVHFQVGRIFAQARQYQKSRTHLELAIKAKPNEPAIWSELVGVVRLFGSKDDVSDLKKTIKKTKLSDAQRKSLLNQLNSEAQKQNVTSKNADDLKKAISALNSGDPKAAVEIAKGALNKEPKLAPMQNVLATALAAIGDKEAATKAYERAIKLAPKSADALNNFGGFLLSQNEFERAASALEKALDLSPKLLQASLNLGRAYKEVGQFNQAETFIKRVLDDTKLAGAAHFELADIASLRGDFSQAEIENQAALDAGLKSSAVFVALGISQSSQNKFNDAMRSFNKAVEEDSTNFRAYYRRGLLHQENGDFDLAKKDFDLAIDKEPSFGPAYEAMTKTQKFDLNDPIVSKMKDLFADSNLLIEHRRPIGYALSKVMEDAKAYDQVFTYLRPANDMMSEEFPYAMEERHQHIRALKDAFSGFDLSEFVGKGYQDAAPIFVTGMPRSGTTLVEQIIASHSTVHGSGELGFASKQGNLLMLKDSDSLYPINSISDTKLFEFGKSVCDEMAKLAPDAIHVTDKAIQSYLIMGLIKAAIPKAKIIVVRRDPRDNLLSIYKNKFIEGTHRYSTDLRMLGEYYKTFVEMIDFWKETAPDIFTEIQYEDLVSNPESNARSLIDACGLEWEDACLNFHQNNSTVRTLSVYQVRQPIFTSSVKAWERYQDDLQPLFEALK